MKHKRWNNVWHFEYRFSIYNFWSADNYCARNFDLLLQKLDTIFLDEWFIMNSFSNLYRVDKNKIGGAIVTYSVIVIEKYIFWLIKTYVFMNPYSILQ